MPEVGKKEVEKMHWKGVQGRWFTPNAKEIKKKTPKGLRGLKVSLEV